MEQAAKSIPVDSITKLVEGILSGGTTGNIIKGCLLLLLLFGAFMFKRWLKKKKIAATQKRNHERNNQNQTTTDQEAQIISEDARNSESEIEDTLEE